MNDIDIQAFERRNANRSMPDSELGNRFGWHRGTSVTNKTHQESREQFSKMAKFLDELLPNGRAKSIAMTHLEEAAMWSNKAIAEMDPVVVEFPEAFNG